MIQPMMPVYCGAGALFGPPTPKGEPCASAASIKPAANSAPVIATPAIRSVRVVRFMPLPCLPPLSGSGTLHQDAVGELCAEELRRIELLVGRHLEQLRRRRRIHLLGTRHQH